MCPKGDTITAMSFTVVPLHNLNFPKGSVISFGKFTVQDPPEWLSKVGILAKLSEHERGGVLRAKQALVSEYFADSYGYPDPEWKGTQPKGIH